MRAVLAVCLVCLCLNSCAASMPPADYYEGLRLRAADATDAGAAVCFEKALDSPNGFIRAAAAGELLSLHAAGREIPDALMKRLRQEAAGSWKAAFAALDAAPPAVPPAAPSSAADAALAYLLGSGGDAFQYGAVFPDEAALFALREFRVRAVFTAAEDAAIEGHIAASRSRFGEGLVQFRTTLENTPQLFFRYGGLLNDLGRCFQYASNNSEGIDRFLAWEAAIAAGDYAALGVSAAEAGAIRFRLLFFAARIARQRGLLDQGIDLFVRALPFAPDSGQADACLWYALDSSLGRGAAAGNAFPAAIRHIEAYGSQWRDPSYFTDVLDKLARVLLGRGQWKELLRVFSLIRGQGGVSLARYAYIIGRCLEEGYFSAEEIRLASEAAGSGVPAAAFMRIAYNTGNASWYYRAQSAAALGEPFWTPPPHKPKDEAPAGQSAAMEFLLGFFRHRAAAFAPPLIKAFETELAPAELRALAEALAQAELYADSIRLVSVYTERSGYEMERRDMELLFPRPFRELVEQYAEETGLAPQLLFGLIRTESAFQSGIVSRAGAAGLTQLIPATAEEMAARILSAGGPDYASGESLNLSDPAVNIHIGAVYLAYLRERMKDPLLALLAYNGGMNRVRRWRNAARLPVDLFLETVEYPETREYGRKVQAAAAIYQALYY
jgi:soluble lytic murein transglycosylase